MLMDVFLGTSILSAWISIYLALPILASSAFNPWIYGYRNSELRCAVRRVVDDLLMSLGFTYRSNQASDPIAPSAAATAGDVGSFINHVQRDCFSWKPDADFLLVPIAKPESSGVASDCADSGKVYSDASRILIASANGSRVLRGSRSMVETFALPKGSDILIKNSNSGMRHGVSLV